MAYDARASPVLKTSSRNEATVMLEANGLIFRLMAAMETVSDPCSHKMRHVFAINDFITPHPSPFKTVSPMPLSLCLESRSAHIPNNPDISPEQLYKRAGEDTWSMFSI